MEFSLPSGDSVDVVFVRKDGVTLIEVKSCISSDDDLNEASINASSIALFIARGGVIYWMSAKRIPKSLRGLCW
ncbi:hypothetical protein [Candidatus Spongiihabitans sp.]|uniref:hypothetical protein n=1 Tax=Candidatus Spongiihabitans sp. TaxID=3101308 RepID=UPI003C6EDCC3